MKVVNLVKGEKWPDGSWWEARPPRDWTARRDHAIHGAPYIFESPSGSRLQIGARQHSELQGFDFLFSIAPADLSAEQQNAFVSTVFAAAMQRLGPDIMETEPLHQRIPKRLKQLTNHSHLASAAREVRKHVLGELVGFTYELDATGDRGWEGYFSRDPWTMYALFKAHEKAVKIDAEPALAVLASIHFYTKRA